METEKQNNDFDRTCRLMHLTLNRWYDYVSLNGRRDDDQKLSEIKSEIKKLAKQLNENNKQ